MTDGKQHNFKRVKKKRNHKSHVTGRCWDLEHMFIFKQNNELYMQFWQDQSASWSGLHDLQLLALHDCYWQDCCFTNIVKKENASTIPPLFYASVCADVVQSLESLESPIQNTTQRSVSVLNVISCTSPLYPVIWHHAQQVKYSDWAKDTSDSAWRVGGKGSSYMIINDHIWYIYISWWIFEAVSHQLQGIHRNSSEFRLPKNLGSLDVAHLSEWQGQLLSHALPIRNKSKPRSSHCRSRLLIQVPSYESYVIK